MKVLVVDDDALFRRMLGRLFTRKGYVSVAAGGVEEAYKIATEAAENNSPLDVLVTDVDMPDGTGFDLVYRLRGCVPTIIVVTALLAEWKVEEARKRDLPIFGKHHFFEQVHEGWEP